MNSTGLKRPARLIELAPQIFEQYQAYAAAVLDSGPLDKRGRALVMLAAALALGHQEMVRLYMAAAKQVGFINEDLGHAGALVDLIHLEYRQRAAGPPAGSEQSCC